MSYRKQTMILMFIYLFLNSVMFGAMFSRPLRPVPLMIGLACGAVSQLIVVYILIIIAKTEPRK